MATPYVRVRRALLLWLLATALFFFGGWALQTFLFRGYWDRIFGILAYLALYAWVAVLIARRVLVEVTAVHERLRAVERARAEQELANARLEAVRVTAREVAHQINNAHAEAVGNLELLARENLPGDARPLLDGARAGIRRATDCVAQLQRVVRVETRETAVGPLLDLDRSTAPVDGHVGNRVPPDPSPGRPVRGPTARE